MAQITYVNKEYLYENGDIPAKNKVQDTDMNQIKSVVNSNETKELLAVTDTAPAQCSTGDKYFNISTKKIYTATATNTWGTTGVNPTRNTIYLEFATQTAYAYDGTTLISVGGGSGSSDIIIVDPDIPTAETKLYIESTDLDFQGLEISNEYNTANNVAYSCNYVNGINGKLLWTNSNPNSGFAPQNITLNSSDYDMYEIIYSNYKGENYYMTSGRTPKGHGKRIMMNTGSSTDGPYTFRRDITYNSATSLGVSTCYVYYNSTQISGNDDLIPLYVIGYKTGLFS